MYTITKAMRDQVEAAGLYIPSNMLSIGKDAKTVKGEKKGYMTGIMYVQPTLKTCPSSIKADCAKACLYSAGRGFFPDVIKGRYNKLMLLEQFPKIAMTALYTSIKRLVAKASREGMIPAVRLNGTSDIDWSSKKLDGKTLFEHFPEVQFYDYTKVPSNARKSQQFENYHVTVSFSNAPSFHRVMLQLVSTGNNMAVVFRGEQPSHFMGLPVINGDDSDLRFLDNEDYIGQVVVGLYAKGKAKNDDNFVVDMTNYQQKMIAIG